MTNLFGMNVTKGEESENMAIETYLCAKVSEKRATELDAQAEKCQDLVKKAYLPTWLNVVMMLLFFGWAIVLIAIVRNLNIGFVQMYQNAPAVFWVGGICLVAWLPLFLYSRKRRKGVAQSEEVKEHEAQSEEVFRAAKEELGIPQHALDVDVLMEQYVVKNGEMKHKHFAWIPYVNFEVFLYKRENSICLATHSEVWEIPLSSFRSMQLQKRRMNFAPWNKEEAPNSDRYKGYKIRENNIGFLAHCYRIDVCDEHGNFYLLVPEYDGDVFMAMTGLKLQE